MRCISYWLLLWSFYSLPALWYLNHCALRSLFLTAFICERFIGFRRTGSWWSSAFILASIGNEWWRWAVPHWSSLPIAYLGHWLFVARYSYSLALGYGAFLCWAYGPNSPSTIASMFGTLKRRSPPFSGTGSGLWPYQRYSHTMCFYIGVLENTEEAIQRSPYFYRVFLWS